MVWSLDPSIHKRLEGILASNPWQQSIRMDREPSISWFQNVVPESVDLITGVLLET